MNSTKIIKYYLSASSHFFGITKADTRAILDSWHAISNKEFPIASQATKRKIQIFRYVFAVLIKGISSSKIQGKKGFLELKLLASQFSLIPRSETEIISRWVRNRFSSHRKINMIDIGTGSGALALSASLSNFGWRVEALDISSKALYSARINAFINKIKNVSFFVGFWLGDAPGKNYDVITSNPPYVSPSDPCLYNLYDEPIRSLISAKYGINSTSIVVKQSKLRLKNFGILVLEHGEKNAHVIRDVLASYGYKDIVSHKDLLGSTRFTTGRAN